MGLMRYSSTVSVLLTVDAVWVTDRSTDRKLSNERLKNKHILHKKIINISLFLY